MNFVSLLAARIFGGLADGLSTTITNDQILALATDSATAAAAIVAAVPGNSAPVAAPEVIAFEAEQVAAIFAGLASGLTVSCFTAVQSAVLTALAGSASSEAQTLQIRSAAQVFAGLALALPSITDEQISTIAGSAATAAAAIQAAVV